MKKFLFNLYSKATALNHQNIFSMLDKNKHAKVLDLGCDEGTFTMKIAEAIGSEDIHGVEIVSERIKQAKKKGIRVKNFDLNEKFDYPSSHFDVVHSNQVVEHIYDSDNFLSESCRILKKGGYLIVSTENASSWCNIFASLLGWQIFSLTNFSNKSAGIGNPIALHKKDGPNENSWNHIRIYNIRGLKEYLEIFGLKVEETKCAGYFPLPGWLGNVDKTHGHFMTFKARKV